MSLSQSAGGSAAARGSGFEDLVFSLAAAAVLAGEPPFGLHLSAAVSVGAQTGHAVDDVVVELRSGWALVQAKRGLRGSARASSALASVADQFARQFLNGIEDDQGTSRPLTPDRDRLVLAVDRESSGTITRDLSSAARKVSNHPRGLGGRDQLSLREHEALDMFVAHLEAALSKHGQLGAVSSAVIGILRLVDIVAVDTSSIPGTIAQVLPVNAFVDRAGAAQVLLSVAHLAAQDRLWHTRSSILGALSSAGTMPNYRAEFDADTDFLRALSDRNLRHLTRWSSLPVGNGVTVNRGATAQALDQVARGAHCLLTGVAGVGKSACLVQVANAIELPKLVLRATDLTALTSQLTHALGPVLREWAPQGVVLIDGLDAVRGSAAQQAATTIVEGLLATDWIVVASIRSHDLASNTSLRASFYDERAHTPVVVEPLNSAEMIQIAASWPGLDTILAENSQLLALLSIPFNLRLVAELSGETLPNRGGQIGQLDLLEGYWRQRVLSDRARQVVASRIATAMVQARRLQIEPPGDVDNLALETLVSEGVLARVPGALNGAVEFSHNLIFDFAVATQFLAPHADQTVAAVMRRLGEDPALDLVARPSLDLVFTRLWRDDRPAIWRLLSELSSANFLLASLACARAITSLAGNASEYLPILEIADFAVLQAVVSAFGSVARHEPASSDVSTESLADALDIVAERVSELAITSGDFQTAALSANILIALRARDRSSPRPYTRVRATAVGNLLRAARRDPRMFEGLAANVLYDLEAAAVAAHDLIGQELRAMLADGAAVSQWAGSVFTPLSRAIPAVDDEMVIAIIELVFGHTEQRDEQVSLGPSGGVLNLVESRRQQAEHAKYEIAERFQSVVARDPSLACRAVCVAFPGGLDEESFMALSYADQIGRVKVWSEYVSLNDERVKMLRLLGAELQTTDEETTDQALRVLIQGLHNAKAWSLILGQMSSPVAATASTALLLDGTLLAHRDSSTAAYRLLASLTSTNAISQGNFDQIVGNVDRIAGERSMSRDVADRVRALSSTTAEVVASELFIDDEEDWEITDREPSMEEESLRSDVATNGSEQIVVEWLRRPIGAQFELPTVDWRDVGLEISTRVSARTVEALSQPSSIPFPAEQASELVRLAIWLAGNGELGHLGDGYWSTGSRDSALDIAAIVVRTPGQDPGATAAAMRLLRDGLDSPEPLLRFKAAKNLSLLLGAGTTDLFNEARQRLSSEQDPQVISALLIHLQSGLRVDPEGLDGFLGPFIERLQELTSGNASRHHLDDEVISYLVVALAAREGLPNATGILKGWLVESGHRLELAERALGALRPFLRTEVLDIRSRAFLLIQPFVDSLAAQSGSVSEGVDENASRFRAQIAHDIANQIYFASGAHSTASETELPRMSRHDFAMRAIPVLESLCAVPLAPIVHPAVETLVYLSPLAEEECLLAIADLAEASPNYVADTVGSGEIEGYLRGLVSGPRSVWSERPAMLAGFRRLLQALASVHNPVALRLTLEFGDALR